MYNLDIKKSSRRIPKIKDYYDNNRKKYNDL